MSIDPRELLECLRGLYDCAARLHELHAGLPPRLPGTATRWEDSA
ncbi:hypothetical protein [Hydrogenophaga intermedia]|nr:hypothetical protein [Hydrogenophaga intermedia]